MLARLQPATQPANHLLEALELLHFACDSQLAPNALTGAKWRHGAKWLAPNGAMAPNGAK